LQIGAVFDIISGEFTLADNRYPYRTWNGEPDMKPLKSFIRIIDLHMIIVVALCVLTTTAALLLKFTANMPTTLISFAIIFPVVFAINASYRRREQALGHFGDIKGQAMSLFYAHRDWMPGDKSFIEESRSRIVKLFEAMRDHLSNRDTDPNKDLEKVYGSISELSQFHEKLREGGMPTGEMSRMNQYVKGIISSFEKMRNIRTYRTPLTLRAFNQIFLNIFPILFAPYFAYLIIGKDPNPPLTNYIIGYGIGILYSIVLVALDNIQEDLENPYDSIGEDDLRLDIVDIYSPFMGEQKA